MEANKQTKKESLGKRYPFLYSDILVWASFGMMLVVKLLTMFAFSITNKDTGAEISAVAVAYETNPFFKLALMLGQTGYILQFIILPATAMATYYYFRRRVKLGKVDIDSLTFFVQFAFFSLLVNIFNDLGGLFGKLV
jgi:hypothetical protein